MSRPRLINPEGDPEAALHDEDGERWTRLWEHNNALVRLPTKAYLTAISCLHLSPRGAWVVFMFLMFLVGVVFMLLSIRDDFNVLFFLLAAVTFMMLATLGKLRD
ncbi:hypothetical protein B0T10DRAFT_497944 [Thelonectria olida]|uniref:Uncharacterized protein n=1 Tax=Thelonectria olida TaxID=1576542 RepID=A0A9P9AIY8_9HYPO|nr:hypothetical protein B0T10DRAFT_497944 [Thelonectria olida]